MRNRRSPFLGALALLAVCGWGTVYAEEMEWTGGVDRQWTISANWDRTWENNGNEDALFGTRGAASNPIDISGSVFADAITVEAGSYTFTGLNGITANSLSVEGGNLTIDNVGPNSIGVVAVAKETTLTLKIGMVGGVEINNGRTLGH